MHPDYLAQLASQHTAALTLDAAHRRLIRRLQTEHTTVTVIWRVWVRLRRALVRHASYMSPPELDWIWR